MKKKIIIIFILFYGTCYCQINRSFTINQKFFKITVTKTETNYSFSLQKIDDSQDQPVTFTSDDLEPIMFAKLFVANLNKLDTAISITNRDALKEADQTFYFALSNLRLLNYLDNRPEAGKIAVSKTVNIYKNGVLQTNYFFEIEKVQIIIQDGFIQDILVDGTIYDKYKHKSASVNFTNAYGIGFSSKRNFDKMDFTHLFINKFKGTDEHLNNTIAYFSIKLGEVVKCYDFETGIYTADFSPSNQKVVLEGGKSSVLYRDETYKLLEAKVYSDFMGFSDEKPNGIIQIEIDKKFNISTERWQINSNNIPIGGFGAFEYIEIIGGLTKLEDNNKFLIPDIDSLADPEKRRFSTPIDILNHRAWYVGANQNLLLFDFPNIKSQFHINAGLNFGRTIIKDPFAVQEATSADSTTSEDFDKIGINYFLIYPEFKWNILPETRLGLCFQYTPKYFYLMSEDIELTPFKNARGQPRTKMSKWINEFEIVGYVYISEEKKNGKLFARWRLESEAAYSKNNFTQFQVGYSFYILTSKP